MSLSNNSSTSTSSNISSERIYDFEYMMKLAASSASAMSSTSTLAQLNSDEDVAEIVKLSSQSHSQEGQDAYYDDSDRYTDSDSDEDEYGSWYEIRTDLSDEQIEELRNAVYDAISLELPLSPVDEDVQLSFALPQQSQQSQSQQSQSQQSQSQQYPAPIVQWQTTRAKSNLGFIPPVQFQSRAFATLATRRQTQFTQRQSQTGINLANARQRTSVANASNAFNSFNPSNPSTAFNWRREVPKYPTRNNLPIRSTTNANVNTVSWRKTQPGLEWKYNEESNGYKLIKV